MADEMIIEPANDSSSGISVQIGDTFLGFEKEVVPEGARAQMRADAVEILSRCTPRKESSPVTGLVVGQIQSGKTMSYEGLVCLARDNGFPLVIVISGISNPLLKQGRDRLREDLSLAAPGRWHFIKNPSTDDGSSTSILEGVSQDWADPDTPPARRRTAVISVLKHHGRLAKLIETLQKSDWSDLPVLIIDDEADQASLNTKAKKSEVSATYRVIMDLRETFPMFSYVQYTATPQAPLLISIADALSPRFVHVLEAGDGYVGGELLFDGDSTYVTTIPPAEILASGDDPFDPPESLLSALRIFFLGLAYELMDDTFTDCRSMLIHPSQGVAAHRTYARWAESNRRNMLELMRDAQNSPEDFQALCDELEVARDALLKTVPDLPSLEAAIPTLRFALKHTNILEMNSARPGSTPDVPWDDFQGFVLVGGQALDRGFTVRGLTVTYMPRGLGVGNADTIQQRARFFGYKSGYLGYCRVYLEGELRRAFESYVEHEADIRGRLKKVQSEDTPLSNWRRAFILDPTLKPTRDNVLANGFLRGPATDDWLYDHAPPHDAESVEKNRAVVKEFVSRYEFENDTGHPDRRTAQSHVVARGLPLGDAIEMFLELSTVDEESSLELTGLLIQLEEALAQSPDEKCDVFVMRPDMRSKRSLRSDGKTISELFQGASIESKTHAQGEVYPGDRAIGDPERITFQIHQLDLEESKKIIAQDVPVIATRLPEKFTIGWFVQGP